MLALQRVDALPLTVSVDCSVNSGQQPVALPILHAFHIGDMADAANAELLTARVPDPYNSWGTAPEGGPKEPSLQRGCYLLISQATMISQATPENSNTF